jgi:triacylglycerol lipase
MFAIPYDPSRESLFHPGRADDFFMHGPISSEAALCAEMSRLAYVKEVPRLQKYLERAGFALVTAMGYDRPGTQAFVATSSGGGARPVAVVAFRGTEPDDPTDLFADARFTKVTWDGAGRVHEGFRNALPDPAALGPMIPAGARVLFTGHSLGAALATLAAALRRPDHLYTFGSPRVGDAEFASGLHGVDHARYVDCCDLVTLVPPEFAGYVHAGDLRYIDRHGVVGAAPSEDAVAKDRVEASAEYVFRYAVFHGTVAARQLADHAPINYISGVMGLRP